MKDTTELLKNLRQLMQDTSKFPKPLEAYCITSEDAHLSEYVADCDKRREYITGFTGSAGTVVITQKEALLWTDGRYFIQAAEELDKNWTLMKEGEPSVSRVDAWLGQNIPEKSCIGLCPKYIEQYLFNRIRNAVNPKEIEIIETEESLVDEVWPDRPPRPTNLVFPHPVKYTGKKSGDKLAEVREVMTQRKAKVIVLSALDDIAWLLNLRGSDIECNPVFFSYVLLYPSTLILYLDEKQQNQEICQHLDEEIGKGKYKIEPYEKFFEDLKQTTKGCKGPKIWLSDDTNAYIANLIPDEDVLIETTPVTLKKGIKNDVEIAGMRNACIRDCAALCCFFAWLEKSIDKCGAMTELSAADVLESFRAEQENYMGLSFETVLGSCEHGASIHYAANKTTDVKLSKDCVILLDSGGQYLDGTTDITRTIHLGTPDARIKELYTLVLKGNLAVQLAVFPNKVFSMVLDGLARRPLWSKGLDYMHGTGHGIGSFLCVHELPSGIFGRYKFEMEAGMIVSDEPGFYEEGSYGFRLEDVIVCVPAKFDGFLTFENCSLIPYDRNLIDTKLLTKEEVDYLNEFHRSCLEKVGSLLEKQGKKDAKNWLEKATRPISICNSA